MKTSPYVMIMRYRHRLATLLEDEDRNKLAIIELMDKIRTLLNEQAGSRN